MIRKGLLGDLHYIRAQWHRGNLPGKDSWQQPMPKAAKPDDPQAEQAGRRTWRTGRPKKLEKRRREEKDRRRIELWTKQIAQNRRRRSKTMRRRQEVRLRGPASQGRRGQGGLRPAGHRGTDPLAAVGPHRRRPDGRIGQPPARRGEHLHRRRARRREAASAERGGRRPTGRCSRADRDVEDHVYCIFEFPAPGYDAKDPIASRKKIGVQYASINGNGFGGYGETVFGTEGTLLLETEKEAMLYQDRTRPRARRRSCRPRAARRTAARPCCRSTRAATPSRRPSARSARCPPNAATPRSWSIGPGASATRRPENLPRCHPEGGHGRRGDRPDDQHGRPARRADRVQEGVVRHRQRRNARRRQAGRDAVQVENCGVGRRCVQRQATVACRDAVRRSLVESPLSQGASDGKVASGRVRQHRRRAWA